jgi:hypothetical protein
MEELMIAIRDRGGKVLERLDYAHPFQDSPEIHRRRLQEVADFISR